MRSSKISQPLGIGLGCHRSLASRLVALVERVKRGLVGDELLAPPWRTIHPPPGLGTSDALL
eukprot:1741684-Alexandrium_andersonii.AAC.1